MEEFFVVDNSVVMSWCFQDETNNYADAVLDKLVQTTAIVPAIWSLEIVNVLLVAERKKRLSESDSVHFLNLLSQLPIIEQLEHPQKNEILSLARTNDLSSYDASYLDLAIREGAQGAVIMDIDSDITFLHSQDRLEDINPEADRSLKNAFPDWKDSSLIIVVSGETSEVVEQGLWRIIGEIVLKKS